MNRDRRVSAEMGRTDARSPGRTCFRMSRRCHRGFACPNTAHQKPSCLPGAARRQQAACGQPRDRLRNHAVAEVRLRHGRCNSEPGHVSRNASRSESRTMRSKAPPMMTVRCAPSPAGRARSGEERCAWRSNWVRSATGPREVPPGSSNWSGLIQRVADVNLPSERAARKPQIRLEGSKHRCDPAPIARSEQPKFAPALRA